LQTVPLVASNSNFIVINERFTKLELAINGTYEYHASYLKTIESVK